MSEAPQPVDRTAALLDRLIDLDMSAAEHVHAQLLAATEPAEVASLSRAYNRCSRGARQSVMLRMSLTLAGFFFVGRDNWERWLLCLLGFLLARFAVKWLSRPPVEHGNCRAPETSYAP